MRKNRTFSLTEDTIEMLDHQAKHFQLSHSAYICLLLVQNEKNRADLKHRVG